MATKVNPIKRVSTTRSSGGEIASTDKVKCPSAFTWTLEDVSRADSGRTGDVIMHKNRIAQKVRVDLEWSYPTTAEISDILQKFNPEYIWVTYLDPLAGGFIEQYFFVGDRSSPMYNASKGLWESVSFAIIEV